MDAAGESFIGSAGSPEGPFRCRRLPHRTSRAAAHADDLALRILTWSPRAVILPHGMGSVLNTHTPLYHPRSSGQAEPRVVQSHSDLTRSDPARKGVHIECEAGNGRRMIISSSDESRCSQDAVVS